MALSLTGGTACTDRTTAAYKEAHGEAAYKDAIAQAMRDEEIMAVPGLREALLNPEVGTNALIVDFLLHPFDGPFWREHSAQDTKATIPAYLGACWGNYGLHLPGAFTAWRDWRGQKMVIGPGIYLDRPVYNIKTNRCAGSITGSKASTMASWTSRPSVASSAHRRMEISKTGPARGALDHLLSTQRRHTQRAMAERGHGCFR